MNRVAALAVIFFVMAGTLEAQSASKAVTAPAPLLPAAATEPTAQDAIHSLLDQQREAWNRGDLKGFMKGYWHSPELTFFAGDHQSTGWDTVYESYHAAYKGKEKSMGRLEFNNLKIEQFAPDAAFVCGNWQLTMKDGSRRHGLSTLILKKLPEGWRIIHDHSS